MASICWSLPHNLLLLSFRDGPVLLVWLSCLKKWMLLLFCLLYWGFSWFKAFVSLGQYFRGFLSCVSRILMVCGSFLAWAIVRWFSSFVLFLIGLSNVFQVAVCSGSSLNALMFVPLWIACCFHLFSVLLGLLALSFMPLSFLYLGLGESLSSLFLECSLPLFCSWLHKPLCFVPPFETVVLYLFLQEFFL